MNHQHTPFIILGFLGIIKIISLVQGGMHNAIIDPVMHIPTQYVALFMGVIEIGVSLLSFYAKPIKSALILIFIGFSFLTYRVLYSYSGSYESCPCLAFAADLHPLIKYYEANILTSMSVYFFLTGTWCWIHESMKHAKT